MASFFEQELRSTAGRVLLHPPATLRPSETALPSTRSPTSTVGAVRESGSYAMET